MLNIGLLQIKFLISEVKNFLYEAYICSEKPPARFVWLDHPFLEPLVDDKTETCFNSSKVKTGCYRILIKTPEYLRIKYLSLTLKGASGCSIYDGAPMIEIWKSLGYCENSEHCASPKVLSLIADYKNGSCSYLWSGGAAFTNEIVLQVIKPVLICHVTMA